MTASERPFDSFAFFSSVRRNSWKRRWLASSVRLSVSAISFRRSRWWETIVAMRLKPSASSENSEAPTRLRRTS